MANWRKIRSIIKWFIPDKILYKYIVPLYKTISGSSTKKKEILRFQINIVDHCNLNCKGCTTFSPLAQEKFIDLEILRRDCARLSELTGGKIELIDLLGGEPLLHNKINDITEIVRSYFPIGEINIVTNGIQLNNMPPDFWENCSTNRITIILSGYPVKLDLDEIKSKAEKSNVKFIIRGNFSGKKIWNKVPFDLDGKQNIKKNFKICFGANFCTFLEDGKLSTCPIPFVIEHFNKFFKKNITVTNANYIDIFKVKDIDEIFDFLRRPIPVCAYCNLGDITYGINWAPSKKEITEWI